MLKENETLGYKIEKLIAAHYKNVTFPTTMHQCFDFSTKTTLFEVKSTHIETTNKSRKYFYMRKGRFNIHRDSHFNLKDKSEAEGKEANYVFVLLNPDHTIKEYRLLHWNEVNEILQGVTCIKRGDYQLLWTKVMEWNRK